MRLHLRLLSRFALGVFIAGLIPFAAQAQNVLLPSVTPAAPKMSAPVAAPASTAVTTPAATPAPAQSSLPTLPTSGPTMGQTSVPLNSQVVYIPAAQQAKMIENEKQTISAVQQGLAEMNQNSAVLASQGNQTKQQRDMLAQTQAANQQAATQLYTQLKQSQQRLTILQAGPLKAADLGQLYQSN